MMCWGMGNLEYPWEANPGRVTVAHPPSTNRNTQFEVEGLHGPDQSTSLPEPED